MEPLPSKTCTKCGINKPLTDFSPRSNRKSLQPHCKVCCATAARKNWRDKSKDPQFRADRVKQQRWNYRVGRRQHKCGDCGAHVEDGKVYCPVCREKRRLNELARRESDRLHKRCPSCGAPNPESGKKLCIACSESRERRYACQTRYEWSLRLKAFEAYGGSYCACCGETEEKFLTIDHVNGNGNDHRRSISRDGNPASVKMYSWLTKNNYPLGFQVLCFNCNCGKYRNGGICPHQQRR